MSDFLNMGGYAFFVWSSYGITFIVLLLTFIQPMFNKRKIMNELKQSLARKAKLARRQV